MLAILTHKYTMLTRRCTLLQLCLMYKIHFSGVSFSIVLYRSAVSSLLRKYERVLFPNAERCLDRSPKVGRFFDYYYYYGVFCFDEGSVEHR